MLKTAIALLALFFGSQAGAEVLEDLCRIKVRDLTLAKQQSARPSLTAAAFDKEIAADSEKRYLIDLGVRQCVIEHAKADFARGDEFQNYCPELSSPYRVACFAEWISKQSIASPFEIAMWAEVANTALQQDILQPKNNKRIAAVLTLEALMIPTEKFALKAGRPMPESLRAAELESFRAIKAKILEGVEGTMARIGETPAQARGPASVGAAPNDKSEAWMKNKLQELKARIRKLK